ncbi:ATP-grasp domain-containing protein [Kineosporia babensis]|uniref:ATP-grasp domain-containing protein n=1 Tax=Kineosporia babensis TaxID=499548 RepID=A0A9X1SXC9_9ACTN|nr:ATP-grasp domain-containing protein [Kineosporia babensis]MCD5315731.1 ATP-grasp domain-containing protein [Kineosporia babensis]
MPDATGDRPCVVVVDAYAAVRSLVLAFRQRGFDCVRVQSTIGVPPVYRSALPVASDFVADIQHEGDVAATVAAVRAFAPVAVVPGGEVGVEFADLLADSLGLPGNGTALSAARRDKYLMVQTLHAAGVHAGRQLRVTDAQELEMWHRRLGGRVVIKPLRSSGSQGVHFCDSPEESVAAYRGLIGELDVFAQPNRAVVAQEYLSGTEYMVNTVSRDGRHQVCDVWRTDRISANGIVDLCDALVLVPSPDQVVPALEKYAFEVLDAMGIQHGPAHLEVRLTPEGPCLVEIGARIAGGGIPATAGLGIGESQLEWTVDAYTDPERFRQRVGTGYALQRHCAIAGMVSPVEGTLREYQGLDEIRSLESFHALALLVEPGGRLSVTVNDLTFPVLVTLVHPLRSVVERDLNTIRHLDGRAFYALVQAGRGT